MCGEGCENCECQPKQRLTATQEDVQGAYDEGYADAFRDARHLFWAEMRIKSGDARMVANTLRKDGSDVDADSFAVASATYFNAAEAILRGRRDFPGYMEDGKDPSDTWRNSDSEEIFPCCDDDVCKCN